MKIILYKCTFNSSGWFRSIFTHSIFHNTPPFTSLYNTSQHFITMSSFTSSSTSSTLIPTMEEFDNSSYTSVDEHLSDEELEARESRDCIDSWPKPISQTEVYHIQSEYERRISEIRDCEKRLAALRADTGVESNTVFDQQSLSVATDAAKKSYDTLVTRLDALHKTLEEVTLETSEARNFRCAKQISALQAAENKLAETRIISETKVPKPAEGSAQKVFAAWKQALTRRTAATEAIPACQANIATEQAALADSICLPERSIRARIATCEVDVKEAVAALAKCRKAEMGVEDLRIQRRNHEAHIGRAIEDLEKAKTEAGFTTISFPSSRARTIAYENKLAELEARTNIDPETRDVLRAEIKARYAKVIAPTLALVSDPRNATVMRDSTTSFAEMVRSRHNLGPALPPEPIRRTLFPNARVPTMEEVRTRVAPNHDLFVENLSPDTTHEDLQGLFRPYGRCRVKLPRNYRTGLSQGFAFITFERIQDAQAALAGLNGFPLNHMIITVKNAAERATGDEDGTKHEAIWNRVPSNFHK